MPRIGMWLLALAGLMIGLVSGCAGIAPASKLASDSQLGLKDPAASGDGHEEEPKSKLAVAGPSSPAVNPPQAGVTDPFENDDDVEPAPAAPAPADSLPMPREVRDSVTTRTAPDATELVTLHMDDLDVRKALEMLSRQAGVNILVSPGVSGSVTVDLRDVPLEQALQAVVKLCNLVVRREGDIIFVTTPEEMNQGNGGTANELAMRVYRLNYVKSTDLQLMVKPFLSARGRMSSTPMPEIGIKSDVTKAGGNSLAGNDVLVVQDHESVLKNVDRVVTELDAQPVQVLIEAVIVSVILEKGHELGVNFAVLDGAGNALAVLGNGAAINSAAGFLPASVLTAGGKLQGTPVSGFAADEHGLKFGFVDKDVTGFIRALDRVGSTKILATPRILVLNKQRAEIQLGERLGFRTLTQTQTSTIQKVEFLQVGTQLRLRPFVSTDGMVRMEVHPERSSGKVVDNVPQTNTSEVTTNVLVPDGSTIVIGGLMEESEDLQTSGIPGLMNMPYLGALFRQKVASKVKRELIVLLTPRIWKPGASPAPPGTCEPEEVIVSDHARDRTKRAR